MDRQDTPKIVVRPSAEALGTKRMEIAARIEIEAAVLSRSLTELMRLTREMEQRSGTKIPHGNISLEVEISAAFRIHLRKLGWILTTLDPHRQASGATLTERLNQQTKHI
jgi:hypothetical protein